MDTMSNKEGKVAIKRVSLGSFMIITGVFVVATTIALCLRIPVPQIVKTYQYDVLVILISLELLTNLIVDTGIMKYIATKLALKSQGDKRKIIILFGAMMFLLSAFMNNITDVMIMLPLVFVLLKAIDLDQKYVCIFFSMILSFSNTGGAASPIGDFPAIVIMTSGITTFGDYLLRAFPVFSLTTIVLLVFWVLQVKKNPDTKMPKLAVELLSARHKHIKVDKPTLIPLAIVFGFMLLAWSFVPQCIMPPEGIAILGYVIAALICAIKGKKIKLNIDFEPVLTIAAFLLLASVVSATGILEQIANALQTQIQDPRLLLLTIMIITSIVSGLFSAGPAAAAMMPVIVTLCETTLSSQSHWVAIAYAASICAGSSLFMWSATSGFILSSKVNEARLGYSWGIGAYFKYGIVNYLIQMTIAIIIMLIVI